MHIFLSLLALSQFVVKPVQSLASPIDSFEFHKLIARQDPSLASDPCDCACGSIAQAGMACAESGSTDLFCFCPAVFDSNHLCASCTGSDSINSTYSAIFPPFALEIITALCTCQDVCRDVAPAFFVCPGGLEGVNCTCSTLEKSYTEECSCCLKRADPWLEPIFSLFKSQCIDYLHGGDRKLQSLFC